MTPKFIGQVDFYTYMFVVLTAGIFVSYSTSTGTTKGHCAACFATVQEAALGGCVP